MTQHPHIHRKKRHQAGVGLIELMIAMAIGLFLLGAVGLLFVSTSASSRTSTLDSQMNEDASIALELIKKQIRLAGFSNIDATGGRKFSSIAVRGCDGGFTTNNSALPFESMSCNNSTAGNDALAIRYEATTLNTQPVTVSGVTKPSNCAYEGIDPWDFDGDITTPKLAVADDRYYIADDTDGTPSLFCRGRTGGGGFGTATALIPNIESMQIRYGVTLAPVMNKPLPHQITGYVTASNTTLATPANLKGWERVAAVQICLIARSNQTVPRDGVDPNITGRYLDCDNNSVVNADGRVRRAYQTTIQLRNMRPAVPLNYVPNQDPWANLVEE
jgi:type IV pilus assembly protein PilW